MKLLVRADASLWMGSGHVSRCLALAAALKPLGAQVTFACRALPGHLLERIAAQGWEALALPVTEADATAAQAEVPWQADIAALRAVLPAQARFDWVVVDHYGLDARWETAARAWGRQLLAIDDLANRPHAVDVLVDQNLTASSVGYGAWLQRRTRLLLGPRYALLREQFQAPARPVRAQATRVLVNFGGMDVAGATLKAMQALAGLPGLEIDFVAGAGHPQWPQLQAMVSAEPGWRLHGHTDAFADLMAAADLFIGAGGGTSWERAALGVPTLCMAVAANQQGNAAALAAAGAHAYLGACDSVSVAQLRDAIVALLADPERRRHYAQVGRQRVDGRGAQRVAVALAAPALHLQAATIDDARALYDGRNAPDVRRWSTQSEPIVWEDHLRWLGATLADPHRRLLLASAADGPVGVLRYDRRGERAEVSIYLLAGRFSLGWGHVLLACGERYLREHCPEVVWIDAQVLPGNQASITLFQDAGYVQHGWRFERSLSDYLPDHLPESGADPAQEQTP